MVKVKLAIFALLVVVLFVEIQGEQFYSKIIHNIDPQAKCLDGSSPMLYIHEGDADKFMFYLMGGGHCGETNLLATLQSCYNRSKTKQGSSIYWPDRFNDSMGLQGLISLAEPIYKNWTKVLFVYCDGAIMQGGYDLPLKYKDTTLYFRGNKIMRAHFKWLSSRYQLGKASKIMLTGGSAGGIAAAMWGNYLQSIVSNPQIVYVIPDSSLFMNLTSFKTGLPTSQIKIQMLMKIAQINQKSPIPQCNKANPGSEYKCLFVQVNYKYLKGKYLFINSQYDQWAISNILQIGCLTKGKSGYTPKNCSIKEMDAIEKYRQYYLNFTNNYLAVQGKGKWGIWSIACSQHVYQIYQNMYDSDLERVPMLKGKTVKDAMQNFILQNKIEWTADSFPWPSNSPCAY